MTAPPSEPHDRTVADPLGGPTALDGAAGEAEDARRRRTDPTGHLAAGEPGADAEATDSEFWTRETGTAPRRGAVRRAVVMVLGAVVLLGAIAVAALALRETTSLQEDVDARDEIVAAAEAFAEAYYDGSTAGGATTRDRLLGLMTEELAEEHASTLEARVGGLETTSGARILEVFVSDATGGRAEALVVADASSPTGDADPTGYLLVTMQRVGTDWKVSSITDLAPLVADRTGGGSGSSIPPTADASATTAPPVPPG